MPSPAPKRISEYTIKRIKKTADYTLGEMYRNGVFLFYTCEDAERAEKIYGKTCIPAGRYELDITMSNRFKKLLPLLLKVPGFEGIRIHAGNTAADTEGCVLIGLTPLENGVGNSRAAMAKFMPILEADINNGGAYVTIF